MQQFIVVKEPKRSKNRNLNLWSFIRVVQAPTKKQAIAACEAEDPMNFGKCEDYSATKAEVLREHFTYQF